MKRPLPMHFKRDGRPKRPLTREAARERAIREHKNAYRCDFCGQWHIGGRSA